MTMDLVSGLPFQAGSAVAAAGKRAVAGAAGWYLRAPLRNSGLALLVSLSAMAASNALYGQQHHHPAPMFGSFSDAPAETAPVLPKMVKAPAKVRSAQPTTTLSQDTTPISPKSVGSDEMLAVQQKLQALNLFTATVDGFYGPRTAKAIKGFEEMLGRKPTGQLTREIIDLIKATPANASAMSVTPAPAALPVKVAPDGTPVRVVSPMTPLEPDEAAATDTTDMTMQPEAEAASPALALAEPAEDILSKPLPAPAPLIGGSNDAPPATATAALSLQATGSDDSAASEASTPALALAAKPVDDAAIDPQTTAGITAGTEDLAPVQPNGVVKRTVQTIAVRAQVPAAAPAAEDRAEVASLTVDPRTANSDPRTIAAVQRGLSQLGFLHTEVTGVADEATAKAIRNFEVYYNYDVTGRITPDLVKLLAQNGAEL